MLVSNADYRTWLTLPGWITAKEGAEILVERDPDRFKSVKNARKHFDEVVRDDASIARRKRHSHGRGRRPLEYCFAEGVQGADDIETDASYWERLTLAAIRECSSEATKEKANLLDRAREVSPAPVLIGRDVDVTGYPLQVFVPPGRVSKDEGWPPLNENVVEADWIARGDILVKLSGLHKKRRGGHVPDAVFSRALKSLEAADRIFACLRASKGYWVSSRERMFFRERRPGERRDESDQADAEAAAIRGLRKDGTGFELPVPSFTH